MPRELPIFQVDAFTERLFRGNPAAVVIADAWLPAETMQAIAAENNLAETAFVVPEGETFGLRWFTPELEIDLCGHATLASAHVLLEHGYVDGDRVVFRYREGRLTVVRQGSRLAMDFPSRPPSPVSTPPGLIEALGASPLEVLESRDLVALFASQAEIEALHPDFQKLAALEAFAVVCTAQGDTCDFVSRFFAPKAGVPEDPVTGSAHCTLVPFWSLRLGKPHLHGRQLSKRGGDIYCEDRGDRVTLAGHAVEYLAGTIRI